MPPLLSSLERHRYLLLAALGVALYVTCLGLRDLWFPNEPNVAQVASAMLASGDWVAPRRMGAVWLDYPPLVYWAGAVSATVLGAMNEVALRLPSALAAVALALVTCAAGSRWFGPAAGLWAGVVLLTSPQFALQAIGYRPDMLFSLFIGAGLLVYASGAGAAPSWTPRVAGFVLFGLAMLTKGPLGLLLPGLVLCLWHGSRREWRSFLALAPLGLLALAIYLAWFIACAYQVGGGRVVEELWSQNAARFGSGARGHGRALHYYAVNIWHDMAPWSLLLPLALWRVWRARLWRDRRAQLLLWWFGVFFVFLSVAATKRQLYLLPAYPAAALLVGHWIAAAARGADGGASWEGRTGTTPSGSGASATIPGVTPWERPTATMTVFLAGGLLAFLGAFLAAAGLGADLLLQRLTLDPQEAAVARSLRTPVVVIGVAALGAGLWTLCALRSAAPPDALRRLAVSLVPLYFLVFSWLLPRFNPVKTYKPAGEWIRRELREEPVFGLANPRKGRAKVAAFGFYTGRGVELLDREDAVVRFLAEHPRSMVVLAEDAVETVFGRGRTAWQAQVVKELVAGGDRYFVLRSLAP